MTKEIDEGRGVFALRAVRLLVGLVLSSALAALIFEIVSRVLRAGSRDQTAWSANFSLRAFIGIWLLDAIFVLALATVVALPSAWIARRLGVANAFTAGAVGLLLGLFVSFLYGDTAIRSLASVLFTICTFGLPGLIAGLTFWAVAKNLFR